MARLSRIAPCALACGLAACAVRADDPCTAPFTPIPAIQGAGATAALTGPVVTRGVVVADFEGRAPALGGFHLQDPTGDGDDATSDAVFVYGGDADRVSLGDDVVVTGVAGEWHGQTELAADAVAICGSAPLPASVAVELPADDLERFEAMRVHFPQRLTVTDVYGLGRFGEVALASGGRHWQPTQLAAPGAPALAAAAANARDRILLDDDSLAQDPEPIPYARDGAPLTAANPLRAGDHAIGVAGVLGWSWGGASASPAAWRVRPAGAPPPLFIAANPRPPTPHRVAGRLVAVGANLHNYFDDHAGCRGGLLGPPLDCRGASSPAEFGRQWRKTVAMLGALAPDLVAAVELANDGYGADSAIRHLVDRLDEASAPGTWAYVDADAGSGRVDALGSDAIRVGLLHRSAALIPVGPPAVLATGAFGPFTTTSGTLQRNRPALAQSYVERASGERFTAVVVHLKSRGSSCRSNRAPVPSDPDTGDGQGHCAGTRLAAARELAAWLASDPTGSGDPDVLVLGDWNAYPREDAIAAFRDAGWVELLASGAEPGPYSYGFAGAWGRLDHAFATPALARQVRAAATWAGNADEPPVLGYESAFQSPARLAALYAPDAYRAADHDPVVVGLMLPEPGPEATALAAGAALVACARARRAQRTLTS